MRRIGLCLLSVWMGVQPLDFRLNEARLSSPASTNLFPVQALSMPALAQNHPSFNTRISKGYQSLARCSLLLFQAIKPTPLQAWSMGIVFIAHLAMHLFTPESLGWTTLSAAASPAEIILVQRLLELFQSTEKTLGVPKPENLLKLHQKQNDGKPLTAAIVIETVGQKFFKDRSAAIAYAQRLSAHLAELQQIRSSSTPQLPPRPAVSPVLEMPDALRLPKSLETQIIERHQEHFRVGLANGLTLTERTDRSMRGLLLDLDQCLSQIVGVEEVFSTYFVYGHPMTYAYALFLASKIDSRMLPAMMAYVEKRIANVEEAGLLTWEDQSPSGRLLSLEDKAHIVYLRRMTSWMKDLLRNKPLLVGMTHGLAQAALTFKDLQATPAPAKRLTSLGLRSATGPAPVQARVYDSWSPEDQEQNAEQFNALLDALERDWNGPSSRLRSGPLSLRVIRFWMQLPGNLQDVYLRVKQVQPGFDKPSSETDEILMVGFWMLYSMRRGVRYSDEAFKKVESLIERFNERHRTRDRKYGSPISFESLISHCVSAFVTTETLPDLLALLETLTLFPLPLHKSLVLGQLGIEALHGPYVRTEEIFDQIAAETLLADIVSLSEQDVFTEKEALTFRTMIIALLMSHYDPGLDERITALLHRLSRLTLLALAEWAVNMAEWDRLAKFPMGSVRNVLGSLWWFLDMNQPVTTYLLANWWDASAQENLPVNFISSRPIRAADLDQLIENDFNTSNRLLLRGHYRLIADHLRQLAGENPIVASSFVQAAS